ncbi:APC family permease [Vibrio spartinae]|uniref:Amino acid permease YhdG n=1 Tax=Vibrio spartinae TaxID=1918945 RepID=A0ABX6R1G5_9VIBR|nr:APC family permease [Vibrio spartinae]QMV15358.1 putative amino acid permease YhdG [Vibrio spartinae]
MKQTTLKKESLGLWSIVFFVIAAASPLTGAVGALPIAFMAGNGAGIPGIYVVAGILLTLFSFGFIAMSRHVVNSGAFYSYVSKGLGPSTGLAGFFIAILAYLSMVFSVSSLFGFFTNIFLVNNFGINVPWWMLAIANQVIVVLLGIAKVEIGGRILGVLMLLEVAIILLVDLVIIKQPIAMTFSSFTPSVTFSGNAGVGLIFAICSFIGFEASAIYSEECKTPEKTIPRATLVAVAIITVFYAVTAWAIVQYVGDTKVGEVAAQDPGMFIYNIADQLLGPWSSQVMSILLITSLFAATQAFHNTLSRYLFSLSRDGLCWSKFSTLHPKYHTPYVASLIQGIAIVVGLLILVAMGLDPMANIFAWASALGAISILTLQCAVSFAVVVFFIRNPSLQASLWSRFIAPALASVGMVISLYMVINNLDVLSGSDSPVVKALPYLVVAFAALGFFIAKRLHQANPERFASIAKVVETLK